MQTLIAATFIFFVASASLAQQIAPSTKEDRAAATRVDRVVRDAMSTYKIPGVSLAVLREGKIILLKSYGLANVEHQIPVKAETIFQSGSIGKQFTAAAIMILAQENKLAARRQDLQILSRRSRGVERDHHLESAYAHIWPG